MTSNAHTVPSTDPKVYDEYKTKWSELPTDETSWLQRAKEVASVLAQDAALRERQNKSPRAEIALLKHSGLLKVLGWKKYGGGEQPWSVGYKVIREVAKGDGDHKITSDGEKVVFNGFKNFNTGGVISDLTVLEGVLEGTEDHLYAIVKTDQPGIVFSHNWDNIGLRLSESGSVKIENVTAPWADALGWNASEKKPDDSILNIPFATLLLPTIQLVFSNFYIGIAWGALDFASAYTRKNTRAWPFGGDNKEKAEDEFYILSTYGNFLAHLRAADALADKAGLEIDKLYKSSGDPSDRAKVTAQARGEAAEWVASVKVTATDTGLRVTSGVFEVTGAKATATKVGLDRFWRDIRTHSLHDPVAYKNRELEGTSCWVRFPRLPGIHEG
ncbi:thermophilic desulfurizing enzyme family protein [Colletotrichum tofieldiae]|nr:thermophilic desulfurizing enzyme family protein [Colletotrichum tofieldiae]